jgi:branched-chain amino acid transport system substrate-binding protein
VPGTKLIRPFCGALLAVALTATACGNSTKATTGSSSSDLKGTISLGAVVPLTGSSATIGEDQKRGIELAVDQVNKDGGLLGKKLEVKIEDSEGRSQAAVDAAKKLVEVSKVPAVIAEYSSGNTVPIGQYLQRQKVVHINAGSSSPEIRKIGDYSFSVIGLDDVAGRFTAKALAAGGHKKAALIFPNNSYGQGIIPELKKSFTAAGGQVVESLLYQEGQSDYRQELQRLAKSQPDVYVYSAYGQEAATINRQAFELGLNKTTWYGIYLSMCIGDSPKQAVEGQKGMDVNYTGSDGDWYRQLYKAKFGEDFKSTFNGYTYDAVMLLAAAIKKAGKADPDAIRTALPVVDRTYKAATGPIVFDQERQRSEQPYIGVEAHNGQLKTVSS